MAGNYRWTGNGATVITDSEDWFTYENVSPCCGTDSQGNAWTLGRKGGSQWGDDVEVHFYRGDKSDLLQPSHWASKAHVTLPHIGSNGAPTEPARRTPCMLVGDDDNLFAWWKRINLWQGAQQLTDSLQGVKGSIGPEAGTLTLDNPVDLGIPYIDGFGVEDIVEYDGPEMDPDGYLWLVSSAQIHVAAPVLDLLYGDELGIGQYRYALTYESTAGFEIGCGYYSGVTTRVEAAVPGRPSGVDGGEGGFPAGTHYFKVTFFKEDATPGNGETLPGLEGSVSLAADDRSIQLTITPSLRNGKRRVYYAASASGPYYLVHAQDDWDTTTVVIPAPVYAGTQPPTENTLPARRVRVRGDTYASPGTVARHIYRTTLQGEAGFWRVSTLNGNTSPWEWIDDTGDAVGSQGPPDSPSPGYYTCIVVGHTNAPRSWSSGVTWETVVGWGKRASNGERCGIVPVGGGLAAVLYSSGIADVGLWACRRTTGGVWGAPVALLSETGSRFVIAALTTAGGGPHAAYLKSTTPFYNEWYCAPLYISDAGVSIGSPVRAGAVSDATGSNPLPGFSWDEDVGGLVMHSPDAAFNIIEGEPEGAGEACSWTGTRPWLWGLASPRRVPGPLLWALSVDFDTAARIAMVWTPTKEDPPDCDEDECPSEDDPPCGPSRSEMNSAWMGDSGGPSGGSPASGFSGYVGGRPASRWVGGAADLSEVTRLRASDASGDVALSHPTSAVRLSFAGGQSGSLPVGRNWTHKFNLMLVQQSENTVDIQHEGGRWDRYRSADSVWDAEDGRRAGLVRNGDGSWSETTPYGVSYNFPTTGGTYPSAVKVASIVDTNGNCTTLSYAGDGLQSVQDAFGQTITFSYDGNGRIQDVTDPSGLLTTFSYENVDLRSVLHPDGTRVTYSYRASHDPVSIQSPLGEVVTLSYDAYDRLQTVASPAGQLVRTITYDATARRAVVIDARGDIWTSTYSETGRPVMRQDPLGRTRQNALEAGFDATAFTDARGSRWTYSYDSLHRRTGMVSPELCVHSYEYNADNMPTVYVDPLGNRTTSVYDSHRNRIAEIHPDGGVVSYSYYPDAPYGRLRDVQDAQGYYTTYTYDARGNLETTLRPDDTVVTFTYNARNQTESTTDPLGHTTTNSYDVMGRLTEVQDPLGSRTTYVYDLLGRQVAVVDPLGNRTTTQYNTLGQVEAQVDAMGHCVSYSYDANGNRIVTVDPLGKVTTFVYDARDRLVAEVNPLGATTSYDYDENGNQRAVIDALGRRTTTSYDAVNRPLTVADPLNHTVETIYYTTGWVKATVDQLGNRTTYSYDAMGRQREVLDALGNRTTYSYDLNSNQIEMQDACGSRWTSVYDCMNRLSASIDPSGAITTHSYDAAGRRTATLHPGGGRTSYSYDAANRQIAVSNDEG